MCRCLDDRNVIEAEKWVYGCLTGQEIAISREMDETGDFDLEVQEANAEEWKSILFCGEMRDLRIVGLRWTLGFDTWNFAYI